MYIKLIVEAFECKHKYRLTVAAEGLTISYTGLVPKDIIHTTIYNQGRVLLETAAGDDQELFLVSECVFILQYGLPVELSEDHISAVKSFNKCYLNQTEEGTF